MATKQAQIERLFDFFHNFIFKTKVMVMLDNIPERTAHIILPNVYIV